MDTKSIINDFFCIVKKIEIDDLKVKSTIKIRIFTRK